MKMQLSPTVSLSLGYFPIICLVLITGCDTTSLDPEAFQVTVNGRSSTADTPYYAVYPGRANSITVHADFEVLEQDALTATFVRTCPDGRSHQSTARLAPKQPQAVFDLGAFAVPAEYDYENGVVYRRGYRFKLTVADAVSDKGIVLYDFYQGPARAANSEALWIGDVDRYVYNSGYDASGEEVYTQIAAAMDTTVGRSLRGMRTYGGGVWQPNKESGRPTDPPFLMNLDWAVLFDPDDVRVQVRQKDGLELGPVPAELIVVRLRDGEAMLKRDVTIGSELATERLDVSKYDEGEYQIELRPIVADTEYREGPRLIYRRTVLDPSEVLVSPLAPWKLRRDPARKELIISDFQDAIGRWGQIPDPKKWIVGQQLLGHGDVWAKPVLLRPGLRGHYAVFASSVGTCYVSAGKDVIVRRLLAFRPRASQAGDHFLVATDMTNGEVAIYQSGTDGQGLVTLRLVPVTEESVAAFEAETSNPPTRLVGHADWVDNFLPGAEPRLAGDQWEALVKGHGELGMRDLHWAVGRSALEYDSKLPNATRFPAVPLDQLDPEIVNKYPHFPTWDYMTNQYCPLTEVERYQQRHGMRIWPWLTMQRHYGMSYGGVFCSKWFKAHPEWRRWRKHAPGPDGGEVCYFFPEVRKERVDILCELAERNVSGIVVDCLRQPPMLLYNPKMVAAYQEETGIDPQAIDASAGKVYEHWIRWRADFFTETLRELKARLASIRERKGEAIPVVIRIPSTGIFYSMAQGFDVETWCREELIDILMLEPLENLGGRGSHDLRPYLELGHRYKIPVLGGINANTFHNYTVIMKRAMGLLDAQVDGIYFYESNGFCVIDHRRWIVPLLGNRERLAEFLKTSNIEACYPVRATNACAGFDNHSFNYNWNVYEGKDGTPL